MNSEVPVVLVIEDEVSVMAYVKAALVRSGYQVVGVSSGAQALEVLKTGDYLGVISDMRTPGGVHGSDVYDWLQAHRPELGNKLIFITGDIVNEDTAATLRRTGSPFVEKPFRVQELIAVVEKTFGRPQ